MVARAASADSSQLAANSAALDALRGKASRDPKGAIREASKQFEALFMQEIMKSMRATTMSSGLLDNSATELGTSMLDQQYATSLSGKPGGLAEVIALQLERQMGLSDTATADSASSAEALAAALAARRQAAQVQSGVNEQTSAVQGATGAVSRSNGGTAQGFVERHTAAAEAAAAESGIPARFMLAQAAHETGWGRKEIRGSDGTNSHNLFGIKAGPNWTGPTVSITTTEVVNGQARKVQAKFRAYGSYEESFKDYAKLISNSPRYAGVMQAGNNAQAFAQGLQRAGYATDPAYAQKLGRIIQTTERLQQTAVAANRTPAAGLNL